MPTNPFENESMQEYIVENAEQATQITNEIIRDLLVSRYSRNGENPLSFHNEAHGEFIRDKGLEVFDDISATAPWCLLGISKEQFDLTTKEPRTLEEHTMKLAKMRVYTSALLYGHDTIQNGRITPDGRLQRNRGKGENDSEGENALELFNILHSLINSEGTLFFEDLTLEQVQRDLFSTYVICTLEPLPGETEKGLHFQQPDIYESSLSGLILGMADLRGAYTTGNYADAKKWGDAEFRELNPWFIKLSEKDLDAISDQEKLNIVASVADWARVQPLFFAWQRLEEIKILDTYFSNLPDTFFPVRQIIEKHFSPDLLQYTIVEAQKYAESLSTRYLPIFSLESKILENNLSQGERELLDGAVLSAFEVSGVNSPLN